MKGQQVDHRKKKASKKGTNVPFSDLGFKAKVYYGIETEYTRKRVKYKAARYGAQNSKQCFMGRLTFVLDPSSLNHQELESLSNFKGISKQEWDKVKVIIYHSREELTCAICLEKKFVAPQMTHCGHVFCWHCIYMHHFKSLKANSCPVCNETYLIDSLVSCKPIYARSFEQLQVNKIKLALKSRVDGDKKVYNASDRKQDLRFARIIKATSQKIKQNYELQNEQLLKYFKVCDDEQIKSWVGKILSLSYDRIEKFSLMMGNNHKRQYKTQKNQYKSDGYYISALDEKAIIINFYQEYNGKFIFLHPLCDKYLRNSKKQMPLQIQEEIIEWQEVQYNIDMMRRYKQINHIIVNQQIDLVTISLKNLISQEDYKLFQLEYQQSKHRKQQQLQREDKQSQRLQAIYEQEKQYLKKLKKMEQSEFYDIRVPTTINLNELGNNQYFPSLIQTKSMPDPATIVTSIPEFQEKKKKVETVIIKEGDFPGLVKIQTNNEQKQQILSPKLQVSKSYDPKLSSNKIQQNQFPNLNTKNNKQQTQNIKLIKKGSRKKKQKFINVTDQFFQRKQQQDN